MVVSFYSKGVDWFIKSGSQLWYDFFYNIQILVHNSSEFEPKGNFSDFLYAKLLKATLYEEFAVNFSLFILADQL
jgi:hypothetical protein